MVARKVQSGGGAKASPRQAKEISREQNPKKGSGVVRANRLDNGYGPPLGIKPCSWGQGSWRVGTVFTQVRHRRTWLMARGDGHVVEA